MVINTREVGDVIIYDLKGRVCRTASEGQTLHQFVKLDLGKGKRNFLFNFQNVEFIDSFRAGEILASYISISNIGGNLKLACIPEKLLSLFITGGHDFMLYENEEAALKSLEKAKI
ncbi:MAG: STAS domain-containing protein [Candidatus Aminicenantales bacterium]|jgi:anti-anti-sigma regulatory factor